MKIAMTGVSGFIGQHLAHALKCDNNTIIEITRTDLTLGAEHIARKICGAKVVINLAGAPINRRWSEAYKQEILSSRIDTTRMLVDAMEKMTQRPEQLISTSAIGAFSSHGSYTEADEPNATDFLGDVSRQWETEALRAKQLNIKTTLFRFGLVLGHDGGLIKQLMQPFKFGLGGPIGNGQQHFSWIHIEDLINAYHYIIKHSQSDDVFHLCAPNPTTNAGFTQALGKALHRPTLFRVPGLFLKLVFGEGSEVMLSGQSVTSSRLSACGFSFRYPDITSALCAIVDTDANKQSAHNLARSLQRQ